MTYGPKLSSFSAGVIIETWPCTHDPLYKYTSIPVTVMLRADVEFRQREAWLQHRIRWPLAGSFRK